MIENRQTINLAFHLPYEFVEHGNDKISAAIFWAIETGLGQSAKAGFAFSPHDQTVGVVDGGRDSPEAILAHAEIPLLGCVIQAVHTEPQIELVGGDPHRPCELVKADDALELGSDHRLELIRICL